MKIVTVDPIPTRLISVEQVSEHQLVFAIDDGVVTYKLHTISHTPLKYAFISMEDSLCWSNGEFPTISKAITAQLSYGGSVIVLDDLKELKEYL